jgi:MFS transporter, BCD family, chlorophyll transporter
MKRVQLLRLGLFQLAAGAVSVIFLGVVNRVMRVELGIDLFLVSLLVGGGHYLGALIAIPFGHYSDTHRIGGYQRTVYALGGTLVTALILAVSPFVVRWISQHQSPIGIMLGLLFFLVEGISTFVAGTAYLALIADLTTGKQRGQVTGVVWTLLMVGIIATGIGTGLVLRQYSFGGFVTLTVTGAAVAMLLSLIALFKQETRQGAAAARPAAGEPKQSFAEALRLLTRSGPARWFAAFLLLSMFSYFMQDAILEPFGGEVFDFDAARTARFNSYMGIGVIVGMLTGGLWLIPRFGKPRITAIGCGLQGGAFGLLAYASLAGQAAWLPLAILFLGLGAGFFTVGGVSMMMDMTFVEHTGLFVGAWTLVQAVAKGPAAIAGGAFQTALVASGSTAAQAYAGVFLFEGIGILVSIIFLWQVHLQSFRSRAESLERVLAQSAD